MRKLPFVLLIILIFILAAATFAERKFGTPFVAHHCYGSWWMLTLWAAMLITGIYICIDKLYKQKKPALLLHSAFAMILLGAFITFATSKKGQVHLRENGKAASSIDLPFQIKLNKFEPDYYEGTPTASDYISHLSVWDDNRHLEATVSMNNILKYRNFRFYQASYDEDLKGTILSVCYDPYGIPVTYSGYLMLFFSMGWLLVSKHGNFRRLIKSLGIAALLIAPSSISAQQTLNKEEAKVFGRLSLFYNGRIVPVDTYAHDFTKKITGKASYQGFNAVQVLAGWIFFPEEWQEEPMVKIKNKEIHRLISNHPKKKGRLRTSDFYSSGIYKLSYTKLPQHHKGQREAAEKTGLLMAQHNGGALKMFPQGNQWYSCTDDLSGVGDEDAVFIANVFLMISETLRLQKHDEVISLFEKIALYQQEQTKESALSPLKTKLEILYNRFDISGLLFKINLTLGLLAFILFLRELLNGKKVKNIHLLFFLQLTVSFILLTTKLCMRWYISGHVPMSNGYETMLCAAWLVLIITIVAGRRIRVFPAAGLLLSGFILLVASLGSMNPQITKLVPVLMSPWLSIHVSLMMISYALLGFIAFNGITSMLLHLFIKDREEHIIKLQKISLIMLYPALFAMAAGIFTGAVWANISWGRYWGWDPKEVWALITMLIYSLAIHNNSLPIFRKPLFFHVFTIIAFLSVVMTYFGVSILFGGMHSYQ